MSAIDFFLGSARVEALAEKLGREPTQTEKEDLAEALGNLLTAQIQSAERLFIRNHKNSAKARQWMTEAMAALHVEQLSVPTNKVTLDMGYYFAARMRDIAEKGRAQHLEAMRKGRNARKRLRKRMRNKRIK